MPISLVGAVGSSRRAAKQQEGEQEAAGKLDERLEQAGKAKQGQSGLVCRGPKVEAKQGQSGLVCRGPKVDSSKQGKRSKANLASYVEAPK
jgi:hypothetical protein